MLCLLPSQMPHPPPGKRKNLLIRVSTEMIIHYCWNSPASAQSWSKQTLLNYFQGPLEGKGTNLEQRNARQLLNLLPGTWLQEALHERQVKAWVPETSQSVRSKAEIKMCVGGEMKNTNKKGNEPEPRDRYMEKSIIASVKWTWCQGDSGSFPCVKFFFNTEWWVKG